MESIQKSRKLRLPSVFKLKREEYPSSQSNARENELEPSSQDFGDRQRVLERYTETAHALKESIQASKGHQWGSFDLPDLSGEPLDFDDSLFRSKINEASTARKAAIKDQKSWGKCQQAALSVFSAFAKNFLTIVKDGQVVIVSVVDGR